MTAVNGTIGRNSPWVFSPDILSVGSRMNLDALYKPHGIASYDQTEMFVSEEHFEKFMRNITKSFKRKDRPGAEEGHYHFIAEFENSDGTIDVLDSVFNFNGPALFLSRLW